MFRYRAQVNPISADDLDVDDLRKLEKMTRGNLCELSHQARLPNWIPLATQADD